MSAIWSLFTLSELASWEVDPGCFASLWNGTTDGPYGWTAPLTCFHLISKVQSEEAPENDQR